MRLSSILLLASLVAAPSCMALRGETKIGIVARRSLQNGEEESGVSVEDPLDSSESSEPEEKADKGDELPSAESGENEMDKEGKDDDKDDTGDKEEKEGKDDKEDKESKKTACKKAKKSKDKTRRRQTFRRHLEEGDEDAEAEITGDEDGLIVDDLPYCSQGLLSSDECSNLDSLSKDGKVQGAIKIELIHDDVKEPEAIASEAEEILDGDTSSRFVGCQDMDAPPQAKKNKTGRRSRRRLNPEDSDYEVGYVDESSTFGVTGVDFDGLNIEKGGCINSDVPQGSVCDVIQSNVDIFYRTSGSDPTDEDEEDMKNLLVETIMSQANAGAFGDLGSVGSVEVESTGGGLFGLGGSGGDTTSSSDGGASVGVYIGAVVGALILMALAYFFCCRGERSSSVAKGKNDDTSDEEQDGGWFGGFNSDDEKKADKASS